MVFLCIMLNDDEGVLVGMYWIYLQDVFVVYGVLKLGWLLWDGVVLLFECVECQLVEVFGLFVIVLWIKFDGVVLDGKWLLSESVLVVYVEQIVCQYVDELFGIQEMQVFVYLVCCDYLEFVGELMWFVLLQCVIEVLCCLLVEQVLIWNLCVIFESLIMWVLNEFDDVIVLVEFVCVDLCWMIIDCYVGMVCQLWVVLFEQNLQEWIESVVMCIKQGNFFVLLSVVKQDIGEQVCVIVQVVQVVGFGGYGNVQGGVWFVVMVVFGVCCYVKMILQLVLFEFVVLLYQEVEEDVQLYMVGWVKNLLDDGMVGVGVDVCVLGVV